MAVLSAGFESTAQVAKHRYHRKEIDDFILFFSTCVWS
jgi:hypothetical protein